MAGHSASEDAREHAYDPAIHPSSQEDGCAGQARAWRFCAL